MGFLKLLMKPFKMIAKLFKSKKAKDGQAADGEESGPEPVRIALLGHTATGKTVFYAVLYDQLRKSPELQMTATSAPTAEYLNRNINLIRGLEDAEDEYGKRITRRVEPRFPEPSIEGGSLSFTLKPAGGQLIPLEMMEYAGEVISLHSVDALSPDAREFFVKADCVFFLIDATMLDAEVEMEARIESLHIMLSSIAKDQDRAAIPLAFIISKADTLAGFEHDDQAVLVPSSYPITKKTTYEKLQAAVLDSDVVKREPVWQQSVQHVLEKTSRLIRVVLHHADGFQIFFVSNIGKPQRSVDEYGATRETPPKDFRSVGLIEPLQWWAGIHKQRQRERSARKFAKVAGWLALVFLIGAALWHFPLHERRFERVAAAWPQDPCAAQLIYLNTFGTQTLHPRLFNAMNFGEFEQDPQTKDWSCLAPQMSCQEFARTNLDELGCKSANLESCEDVQDSCLEPVGQLITRLRTQLVADAAGEESAEETSEESAPGRYARCWRDLQSGMESRIRDAQSGLNQDIGRSYSRLMRAIRSLGGDQQPDFQEVTDRILRSTRTLLACAGTGGGDEGGEGAGDDLLETLIDTESADFVSTLHDVLDSTADGGPSPLTGCDPVLLVQTAKEVRLRLGMHQVVTSAPELGDGLTGLNNAIYERSFFCLEQASDCSNLGSAPIEDIEACKQAIDAYRAAGVPTPLLQRANALDGRANRRLDALASRDHQQEVAKVEAGQAGAQAGGGAGAGAAAGAQGGAQAGGGAEAGAAGNAATQAAMQQASQSWNGLRLTFLGFSAGGDLADHIYFRFSPNESWDSQALWEDFSNRFCLERATGRVFMAVSLDANEETGGIDARFAREFTWDDLGQLLIENGQPGGDAAVADKVDLVFDPGMVANFKLEAFTDGCP